MDDNLVNYKTKKIMQSIEDIRGKKSEIAQALRALKIGKPQENEEVKEDMKQLIAAYDAISEQETQYTNILKTIVEIHEQATLDIAKDFEKKLKKMTQKLKEQKENKKKKKRKRTMKRITLKKLQKNWLTVK
uniref:Coiled-coil domain-containing protein 22 homolog n=1 Tax=Caenorhabditis tropicalis TaxID=1561998 RepID=A0A1I7SXI0_9PELO